MNNSILMMCFWKHLKNEHGPHHAESNVRPLIAHGIAACVRQLPCVALLNARLRDELPVRPASHGGEWIGCWSRTHCMTKSLAASDETPSPSVTQCEACGELPGH